MLDLENRCGWNDRGSQHLKNLKITCPKQNPTECPYIYCYDSKKLKDLDKVSNECPPSVGTNVHVSARDSCHTDMFGSEAPIQTLALGAWTLMSVV